MAGVLDHVGFAGAGSDGRFFVKVQFDISGFDDGVDAAEGLGVEGVAGVADQTQVFGVFWAFEIFEPLAVD
ncbi:hypothetical protein D3C84_1195550 [compost metagenome]